MSNGHHEGMTMSPPSSDGPNNMNPSTNYMKMDMMSMHMSFYWGSDAIILFSGWPGDNKIGMYILALVFVFLVAVATEVFRVLAEVAVKRGMKPFVGGLSQAILHGARMALLYLVMLSVMSFNLGIFIAAVVGHAFGFLLVLLMKTPEPLPKFNNFTESDVALA